MHKQRMREENFQTEGSSRAFSWRKVRWMAALAAALCVGLQEGMPLMRLAAFCNSAGTLVITRRGAIGLALPTREQVEALAASEACRVTCLPLDSMP